MLKRYYQWKPRSIVATMVFIRPRDTDTLLPFSITSEWEGMPPHGHCPWDGGYLCGFLPPGTNCKTLAFACCPLVPPQRSTMYVPRSYPLCLSNYSPRLSVCQSIAHSWHMLGNDSYVMLIAPLNKIERQRTPTWCHSLSVGRSCAWAMLSILINTFLCRNKWSNLLNVSSLQDVNCGEDIVGQPPGWLDS